MKFMKLKNPTAGTPITLLDMNKAWKISLPAGIVFLLISLYLWWQQGIDETVLFHFNPARIAGAPIVIVSKWLSSYGMAFITVVFVLYLLVSLWKTSLDAPLTIYLYTIMSFGLSGIAGDLLKEVFARPRPVAMFADLIYAISNAASYAIPSGHATKSVSLVLPFIFLVSSSRNIHKTVKVIVGLTAVGVCISRVVLGAHYVSDVLAGVGVALVGLPLTMLFSNMILKRMKAEMLPTVSKVWGLLLIALTILFLII